MKVTVKEKTENEIDWDAPQLLILHRTEGDLIILSNGKYTEISFEGVVISEEDERNRHINALFSFSEKWNKRKFKKFNGTITIEQ